MIVKIMGFVDILAALMLFFTPITGFLGSIKTILVVVLVLKGLPSLIG